MHWIRRSTGDYLCMETQATADTAASVGQYVIRIGGTTVAAGYTTQTAARTALDNFMTQIGYHTVPVGP